MTLNSVCNHEIKYLQIKTLNYNINILKLKIETKCLDFKIL